MQDFHMPDSWYDPPENEYECQCDCDPCSEGECEECDEPLHDYDLYGYEEDEDEGFEYEENFE